MGTLASVQGSVEVQRAGFSDWLSIDQGNTLCTGDVIRVGERSRVEVSLTNNVKLRGDQNSTLRLISPPENRVTVLDLLRGAVYFFSRQERSLNVDTPFVNAAVEGTEFLIRVTDLQTDINVFNGGVVARNDFGELKLNNGQSAVARASQAPEGYLLVRPFDAVQWAIYYPPVLAPPTATAGLPEELWAAVELAKRGRTAEAFERFDAIPEGERDATYFLYRAETLLAVGRVEEAEADLSEVLARDPENGEAYAVRAIVAVARNRPDEALDLAERAVALAPRSAAAKIALSYAKQSRFEIEAARETMTQAVEDEPSNALAWARLSELWLMLGWRNRAVETAKRAGELAPHLGKVQTVLGFAALAEIDTRRAAKAFRRAIELDQANPLPRFGLGLATIRDGHLRRGRAEIETAVLLDPNNSLLRSYLGKAYFEERTTDPIAYIEQMFAGQPRNEKLAAEQFGLAKELDPLDPTPYLYSAIQKQSENRPVEALHDIQKSIELNDNRAVFRSRALLDQDQAARGTSLARIYNDLGFEQLGINEATKSLSYDPANAGAHRFLSDIYATQPRREIARVSELLQAQLLQDININPVQPSLSVNNLDIYNSAGPTRIGFNEYTPLFERNQAQLNLSGMVGSNYTFAGESIVSGVYDNLSISAGQFHGETNGFRENANLNQDTYDVFAQAALSPSLNVQAEYIRRTSEEGDLRLSFDPDVFSANRQRELDQELIRTGARFSPSPSLDVLGSVIYGNRHAKLFDDVFIPFAGIPGGGFLTPNDVRGNQHGIQGEGQVLFHNSRGSITSGFGIYDIDNKIRNGFPQFGLRMHDASTESQQTGYVYIDRILLDGLYSTLGFSFDNYHMGDFQNQNYDVRRYSPKAGIRWDLSEQVSARMAAFQTVKPALFANRTIQPTQVVGFNQFYDGINGTTAWNYAGAVDLRFTSEIYGGLEITWRDLDVPAPSFGNELEKTWRQQLYSGYLYWTPGSDWSLRTGVNYNIFGSDQTSPTDYPFLQQVKTISVPLNARYFTDFGLFAGAGATLLHQDVDSQPGGITVGGNDDVILLDASLGYRFPQRRGIISVDILNIFNQRFKYQDDSYLTTGVATDQPNSSPFVPERTIVARATLNF